MSNPRTADLLEKHRAAKRQTLEDRVRDYAAPLIKAVGERDRAEVALAGVMATVGFIPSRRGMWRCMVCQETRRSPYQIAQHRIACIYDDE